ncbi:Aste57867_1192 [Aphanomyces stellatus]|uniref:Aste57867_1192 protein n=1 Tax=Aphanomyces stellatus TaxID=120398 RepID=A0A485KA19_9STRA|nr:hypothetical protein As57867_001191 [Aphanomyces stellatus]VFT78412.1 Aste57867_1192 [Aphanomyces stellatus]
MFGVATTSALLAVCLSTTSASSLPRCAPPDVVALKDAIHADPLRPVCEADVGESLSQLELGNLTSTQADAFANSTSCEAFFGIVQTTAASTSTCAELHDWLPKVTWPMVTGLVDVLGCPLAANECDLDQLQSAIMPLSISSNLLPCLAATGLAMNYMTHSPPVSAQWQLVGTTPACHALYSQARDIVLARPACNVQGVNIHAVDRIKFNQVIQWVVLTTDAQKDLAATSFFAILDAVMPSQAQAHRSAYGWPVLVVFLGICVAATLWRRRRALIPGPALTPGEDRALLPGKYYLN